jgi:hypothetical protein
MVKPRVQEFARKCLNRSRLLNPHGRRAGASPGSHRQHLIGAIGSPEADKAEVFLGQRHKRAVAAGLVWLTRLVTAMRKTLVRAGRVGGI